MKLISLVKLIQAAVMPLGILALILSTAGCAASASKTKSASAAERTPSWMKRDVVGSRIPRRIDAGGQPVSSDNVVMTSDEGLQNLPSVTPDTSH